MTAQQLKNSILQMAVQGKLVPQDPNDEPASVLLERIRAEKEKLIKEGKIKKEKNPSVIFRSEDNLPYEKVGKNEPVCIADEVPFEIPESWEWCRLGTLMSIISDGTHKTPTYVEKGVPFLSVQNISKGYFDLTRIKYITQEEHEKLIQRVKPQLNDILMCRIGTLGKAIKCTVDFEFSIFVSLGLLRPVCAETADYIIFAINSPLGDKWIQDNKVGGGTHTYKINLVDIPNMLIPIPPQAEQERIFAKMSELDSPLAAYDITETKINSLSKSFPDDLRKSILQQAVMGKLVPQDENDEPASVLLERIRAEKQALIKAGKIKRDKHESVIVTRDKIPYEIIDGKERCIADEVPFELPESWCWCRLGTITTVLGGKRIPAGSKLSLEKTDHIYIRVSDMKDSGVSMDNLQYVPDDIYPSISRYIINKEDIYITVAGTIGKVGKIPPELDGANLTENADRLVFSIINQDWLIMCLQSSVVQSQIADATTKVGQPKLAIARIQNLFIPLPPVDEQSRIVAKIEEIMPYINTITK